MHFQHMPMWSALQKMFLMACKEGIKEFNLPFQETRLDCKVVPGVDAGHILHQKRYARLASTDGVCADSSAVDAPPCERHATVRLPLQASRT